MLAQADDDRWMDLGRVDASGASTSMGSGRCDGTFQDTFPVAAQSVRDLLIGDSGTGREVQVVARAPVFLGWTHRGAGKSIVPQQSGKVLPLWWGGGTGQSYALKIQHIPNSRVIPTAKRRRSMVCHALRLLTPLQEKPHDQHQAPATAC